VEQKCFFSPSLSIGKGKILSFVGNDRYSWLNDAINHDPDCDPELHIKKFLDFWFQQKRVSIS
jgi:hypothetical protein